MMQWLSRDFRYALRESLRRPGFTLLAILTLALGIGAVTTMYSVIYNVLLNPFPYTNPRAMVDVVIQDTGQSHGGIRGALTIPEFRAYVDDSKIFEEAVGTDLGEMVYRADYGVEQFSVASVTPNSFHFLGVAPLMGRAITAADAKPGAPPVAILSHKAWMTYFGGDPAILGRKIVLDEKAMNVIGVMPPHFTWHVADVWIPDAAEPGDPDAMKKGFWLQGRLKPGISMQQASAQLNVIGARLARLYPERYPKQFTIKVLTVIDWVVGRFRWVLYTLFGAVGLLLLIACCNVANMLLARATAREREIGIRAALGATRLQILRQLLLESLLLALGGGLIGVLLAYAGTKVLVHFIPPYTIPVETEITIRLPVLLFSLAVATLTALLFGAAPALHSMRRDLARSLSSAGKGAGGGFGRGGLRNFLVVSEVALSLVLLAGAGVLMRSFVSMINVDLGFNPHNILVTRMSFPKATPTQKRRFFELALPRLAGLPGVIGAAEATGVPPYGGMTTDIDIPGKVHAERWTGQFQLCSASYFRTIGFRFLSGSPLSRADVDNARKVAVVNQTLVRKFFGNDDPIGRPIRLARLTAVPDPVSDPSFKIIGVVADIRNQGIEEPSLPEAYIPSTITGAGFPAILIRTSVGAERMSKSVRHEIRAVDGNVVQRDPATVDSLLRDFSYARPRFSVLLLSVFAGIGLVLVGTGVYGVMAYSVSRQTREIGIRMALGAGRADVFRTVSGKALQLIGLGVAIGALASFATNRVISSQVWTVGIFDPIALIGGVIAIAVLGLAACYVPALRATRVNPVVALRHE
jgi:putative ABC transport system permease protein